MLGRSLALIGFGLTIISTGAFLFDDINAFFNDVRDSWHTYCNEGTHPQLFGLNRVNWTNTGKFIGGSLVVIVMAFSTAAMANICNTKVGSFWYPFLARPGLLLFGKVIFIAACVAFVAVFTCSN